MQYEKMIRMLKFLENLMIMGVFHVYSFTTEVSTTWKLKSSFALKKILYTFMGQSNRGFETQEAI